MNLCKGEETEGQTHAVCWGRRSDEFAGPQWSDGNPTQSEDSGLGSDCGLMQTRDQTQRKTWSRWQKNKVEMQEKEVNKKWFEKTCVRERQGTSQTVAQVTGDTHSTGWIFQCPPASGGSASWSGDGASARGQNWSSHGSPELWDPPAPAFQLCHLWKAEKHRQRVQVHI